MGCASSAFRRERRQSVYSSRSSLASTDSSSEEEEEIDEVSAEKFKLKEVETVSMNVSYRPKKGYLYLISLQSPLACIICAQNRVNTVFQCGHMICELCADGKFRLSFLYETFYPYAVLQRRKRRCHLCRTPIKQQIKVYI